MKYRIPPFLRKEPSYMKHFYNRVRRMKRNGYTYDPVEDAMSNHLIYAAHLRGERKIELFEKEEKNIERIMKYREERQDRKPPKPTLQMLHEIEKKKCIYDIHYCNAGVGFIFYTGPKDYPFNWRTFLSVERYYPTFEEAVKGEWEKIER